MKKLPLILITVTMFSSVSAQAEESSPKAQPTIYPNITVRHEPAPEKARRKLPPVETPRTELPQRPGRTPKGGIVIRLDETYRVHGCHDGCLKQVAEQKGTPESPPAPDRPRQD